MDLLLDMFENKGEHMSKSNKKDKIKYEHIAVLPPTKKRFDDLCKIKGMTKDGLLRHLMERA